MNSENEFEKNLNGGTENANKIDGGMEVSDGEIELSADKESDSEKIQKTEFGDNDISADIFEKKDSVEPEPAGEMPDPEKSAESSAMCDEEARRSEIVYNSGKDGSGYSCNYVAQPSKTSKKRVKTGSSKGMRICALLIAAVFTLTFVGFSIFSVCDRMGVLDKYKLSGTDGNENEEVFQMTVAKGSSDAEKKPGSEKVSEILSVGNSSDASGNLSVNQIAEKCGPSSVGILVEKQSYYFGRAYSSRGVGSGFILSEDGYIATNNHVVSGATKITVVLDDKTEYEAELVGADAVTDIAVVKIDAENLPVMERGNSDELKVGDLAVAIGTPASIELAGTVTDGIISAVDRKIDITDDYGRVIKTMTLIQTNATINPGNSGGPLINGKGQVIGINTMKLTDEFEGIGFAIPINGAIKIMNQLIADGEVTERNDELVSGKASIGIQCTDVTEEESEYYGIPQGVLVMQISKSGSAAKAGLRRGDIIIGFDGTEVSTTNEINDIKDKYKAGDEVTLRVYRDGEGELDITFKLDMQS